MSTDDTISYHTSTGADHKAATLDYIIDMLGKFSSLALGIGEIGMAEDLRCIAIAYRALPDSQEQAPATN